MTYNNCYTHFSVHVPASYTVSSQNTSPFLHTILRQKWGRVVLILFCGYASPAVPHTIVTTAVTLWMNGSFDERVLQEISGACVKTKPRGIEVTCIVGGNRGRPRVKFALPVQAAKTLVVASEQGYSTFVCTCLQTQSMTELNQNLTKACRENARYEAFTCRKNAYVKTWGLREGRSLEGGVFLGTYVRYMY